MLKNRKIKRLNGVYQIKNLINNKIYIGSTIDLYNRYHSHKSKLKRKVHSNKHLESSYQKYGFNNFEFKVLIYCNKESLLKIEQLYINKLNPEYNKRKIAESNYGYNHSSETKNKISDTLKEQYNSGNKITYKQQHLWKKVEQYSLDGEYIQSFDNPTDASNYIGCYNSIILRCLNRENRVSMGYQWKYEDEDIVFKKAIITSNNSMKIIMLDITLNKEHVFNSIKLCADYLNTNRGSINKVLARKNKIYKKRYKINYQA